MIVRPPDFPSNATTRSKFSISQWNISTSTFTFPSGWIQSLGYVTEHSVCTAMGRTSIIDFEINRFNNKTRLRHSDTWKKSIYLEDVIKRTDSNSHSCFIQPPPSLHPFIYPPSLSKSIKQWDSNQCVVMRRDSGLFPSSTPHHHFYFPINHRDFFPSLSSRAVVKLRQTLHFLRFILYVRGDVLHVQMFHSNSGQD